MTVDPPEPTTPSSPAKADRAGEIANVDWRWRVTDADVVERAGVPDDDEDTELVHERNRDTEDAQGASGRNTDRDLSEGDRRVWTSSSERTEAIEAGGPSSACRPPSRTGR